MSNILNNTTSLQEVLEALQNKAAGGGGEQATPVISIDNSTGLITATAGTKSATKQLAFQPAKTITPSATGQIAVSSGYYTGGNITVAPVPTQVKTATPKSATQYITPDSGKFLVKVAINGDNNLTAGNIKNGVSIFGVNGTYEGSGGSGEAAEWSEAEDAIIMRTISTYTNDRVTSIGECVFQYCSKLTAVNFPACTNIGRYAFSSCSNLTSVSFPACTSIGDNAFQYCSSLTNVNFPVCTIIGSYAFARCTKLTNASFPVCTSISNQAFQYCSSLTSVNFPACTIIGSIAFQHCSKLTTASFPVCTSIGSSAFGYCYSLTNVNFPACISIGDYAIEHCSSLTSVNFPACTSIGSFAFSGCSRLAAVYLGKDTLGASTLTTPYIYSAAFTGCQQLTTLTLYYSSVATLSNIKAFQATPMSVSTLTGSFGSIYVPASLVAAYKSATNWATYANRITAIVENENLITFYINDSDHAYTAPDGSTWQSWIASDYNTTGCYINDKGWVCVPLEGAFGTDIWVVLGSDFNPVSSTATIISGTTYSADLESMM